MLITGASGCGKSTLALALCGLIPTRVHGELRGDVVFEGRPLSGLAPHEASQLVGMVFQNPNLQLINQTVQSEVAFGPENLALPQPEIAARVEWCLDVTGMAGLRHSAVVTLSGGQKQRTAIAATLAMRPRVLVLDEPLSDLDPVGAQEVLGTLRRLARDGGTGIVIIEHRVDEVVPWADRVVLMAAGKILLDVTPGEAWHDESPWRATGVGIPDMVRLAHALPGAYGGQVPLSVDHAVAALRDSWFVPALAKALGARAPAPPAPTSPTAPPTPPVLSWDHVSVTFDGKPAVDDVTLSIPDGEWVALIGANGSGKSTLTGLSVGLSAASSGTVSVRGKRVRPGRIFEHSAQVALLLQAADEMLFAETVLGELEFGTKFRALPADPVLDVAGAIEFFGFTGLESVSPWELSQGGRQRLALLERVREHTGLTVVTVTHDIRTVAARAARVVLLGEGQVRLDGRADEVFARTGELSRWGVLAPPVARLQAELLGPATSHVLLDVDTLAAAVAAHRGQPSRVGQPSPAGQP